MNSSYESQLYPSIKVNMIKLEGEDCILLKYDVENFFQPQFHDDLYKIDFEKIKSNYIHYLEQNTWQQYLDEICLTARNFLLNYYSKTKTTTEAADIVDNFPFKSVLIEGNLPSGFGSALLGGLFILRYNDIIPFENNSIYVRQLCIFSKLYIQYNLNYSRDSSPDSSDSNHSSPYYNRDDEYLSRELWDEHLSLIIKELKIRIQNWLKSSVSQGNTNTNCTWEDFNLKYHKGLILELPDNEKTLFTKALSQYLDQYPWKGDPLTGNDNLHVVATYIYLSIAKMSTRPLNQRMIDSIITELVTRKNRFIPSEQLCCKLLTFNITLYMGLVLNTNADESEYDFTHELQRLYKQEPSFFNEQFEQTDINLLISNLEELKKD